MNAVRTVSAFMAARGISRAWVIVSIAAALWVPFVTFAIVAVA